MVEDRDAIYRALQGVLDAVVVSLTDHGIEVPERQFVTVADVVHDCEQIAVKFDQLYIGSPGAEADSPQPCNAARTIVGQVHVVTCVPVPRSRQSVSIPVDELNETTNRTTGIAWALLEGIGASPAADLYGFLSDITVGESKSGMQAVIANMSVGVP